MPITSKFSGIIGNNILNASLSHTASLMVLVTSPIIVFGITIEIGETITLAFFEDTIMAFSPVAPLLAWAFIIALVAIEFVPNAYISTYVRLIRNNMVQNKRENYVLYARVRGLKESTIIKHVFKNSLQTSITALGMSIPKLIAGTVVVESIFAWPGIGRLCVTAIYNRDYPIIQAYILIMALLFVVCNLLVDIFSAVLDPRMRREA